MVDSPEINAYYGSMQAPSSVIIVRTEVNHTTNLCLSDMPNLLEEKS